ncbi:hypothetical protein DFQ28_000419 [Apophysomyces sp. BC1034]|nr:hypothetical protein DFQ30_000826 [Apophysomyces sp. BC1015]KAG0167799.1 hypothetical protein DFQ29_000267 [Apophysomyces sp. BC1021]KAG0183946.1 hypothetical protein DFQ28_000419 [Apophysomyces sp. BC1034]
MTFSYGYEMESSPGHVVVPPLLSKKITVTSAGNTNRWSFYGTRKQILDWLREHKDIVLENTAFSTGNAGTVQTRTEIVIDLQYIIDSEQSYYNYFRSYFVSDYAIEKIKVEIRPRIENKDSMIMTMCRVIVASGVRIGDIVDELEREWHKPAQSYYQQTVELFNDGPAPVRVLGADAPTSIAVGENLQQTRPPPTEGTQ